MSISCRLIFEDPLKGKNTSLNRQNHKIFGPRGRDLDIYIYISGGEVTNNLVLFSVEFCCGGLQ